MKTYFVVAGALLVVAALAGWELLAGGLAGAKGGEMDAKAGSKTLYVAPTTADCVGVGPMKCMQVRERPNAPWTLFYGRIEGFEYEPGFLYELQVREEHVPNPPADASSIRTVLLNVISKTAAPEPPAAGLDGTSWELAELGPGQPLAAVERKPTLEFGAEGAVGGFSGVNRFRGKAMLEGDKLSFGPLATTRMAGPPAAMELEQRYLEALGRVAGYELTGGRLTLRDAASQQVLAFVAAQD